MSINVTVTGNPVNIKKGKMVCYDRNNSQKEFEKRRLMRLEQVRQQSKEIAEDVRKKVHREKTKQLSQLEKEGENRLKKWQARKLSELQNQYKEAVKDIGLGHKEATFLPSDSDIILEEKVRNNMVTRDRGQKAAEKLQVDKNEASYKQALPRQRRKLAREIEDTRAALVSDLHKKRKSPFKKKKKRRKSVDDHGGYESDMESDIPNLEIADSDESAQDLSSSECESPNQATSLDEVIHISDKEGTHVTESRKQPSTKSNRISDITTKKDRQRGDGHASKNAVDSQKMLSETIKSHVVSQGQQTSSSLLRRVGAEDKSIQAFSRESFNTRLEIPVDTRISDRIKSRSTIRNGTDICDTFKERMCMCNIFTRPLCYCENKSNKFVEKATVDTDINVKESFNRVDENRHRNDLYHIPKKTGKYLEQNDKDNGEKLSFNNDVPLKPKVVLQSSKNDVYNAPSNQNKIDYYDHENRLSKDYIKDDSRVERITEDDFRVSPGGNSDIQYYDKVYKRDKDAQVRGQKALEKERIQREYKELLKKLPGLQRQERICEITNDKPEYHMSEERLQDRERKRQNKMENAYERVFTQRKPAVVTIPRKTHEKQDVNLTPFKAAKSREQSPVLNLGEWDVEPKPQKDSYSDQLQSDKHRREQLKQLLESLQSQKKMLLKEIQNLPQDCSLHELVNGHLENSEPEDLPNAGIDHTLVNDTCDSKETFQQPKISRMPRVKKDVQESEGESYELPHSVAIKSHKGKSKRRRSPAKSLNVSVESSLDPDKKLSKEEKYRKRHEKCLTSEAATSPTSPSPRKKAKVKKYKKRVLILQNCSTQTTPLEVKRKDKIESKQETLLPERNINKIKDTVVDLTNAPLVEAKQTTSDLAQDGQSKLQNTCPKKHIPCDCINSHDKDYPEDFCQIVIKIKEDEKPEVTVTPQERTKNVQIITEDRNLQDDTIHALPQEAKVHRKSNEKHQKKVHGQRDTIEDKTIPPKSPFSHEEYDKKTSTAECDRKGKPTVKNKPKSWRQQFSKNSSEETSSTSYFSPPDFAKIRTEIVKSKSGNETQQTQSCNYDELLKKKPQQHNIDKSDAGSSKSDISRASQRPSRDIDPRLITYIKKLITMSRKNINDLCISTVSEVSTPSQSIIEMETNKPLDQLQSIMKYFNINTADLQHHLSYSSNGSNAQLKTQENFTLSSVDGSQINTQNSQSFSFSSKNIRKEDSCKQNVVQKTSDVTTNRSLEKYAEIAESCNKRISSLSAMIQQVREEKMKILQSPPGSDPDQSTKYMNLPIFEVHKENGEGSNNTDSSSSIDEELQRNLLKIDYSLAEKLKKMSPEEIKQHEQHLYDKLDTEDQTSSVSMSDSDRELFARLQNLLQSSGKAVRDVRKGDKQKSSSKDRSVAFSLVDAPATLQAETTKEPTNVPFVPLLLDIPKLPKLILNPLQPELSESNHRRPPPSKGLSVAKKFNGEIAAVIPHELSTIVEADSQLSTKVDQSPAPKCSTHTPQKRTTSTRLTTNKLKEDDKIDTLDKTLKSSRSKSSDNEKSVVSQGKPSESDQSLIDMLNDINKSLLVSSKNDTVHSNQDGAKLSGSSSDDMEAVEKMLRSIGMEWAITTLRKTKEALALSSSSSSIDLNNKNIRNKSKGSKSSDISLRELLAQQMVAKISSSTLKSNVSTPNNLLGESQELSAIQFSLEKSQQRASTPIQSSSRSIDKSKSPQKVVFSGESEISTVKNNSKEVKNEMTFYSLSETPSSNS